MKDLVQDLKTIQETVQLSKKSDKEDATKDKSNWCDFHNDHGDTTNDCISLRRELAYLKSKCHLKNIVISDVTLVNKD